MRNETRTARLIAGLAFVGCLFALPSRSAGQDTALPEGPGVEVARAACLSCHDGGPIGQQKMTRARWQAEVEKMIRWGADVEPAQKDALVDYFFGHFGAKSVIPPRESSPLPEGKGLALVTENCLGCHGPEPLSQQRLSKTQWTNEVEKMVRWGAEMSADKKAGVIDYLSEHFPNVR